MLRVLLSLNLLLAPSAGHCENTFAGPEAKTDNEVPRFQFVIPLKSPTFRVDRHGNFRFEYRNCDYGALGSALGQCRDENLIPNYEAAPIEIWVYLSSKQVLEERHQEIADEVRAQFKKYFPNADLRFVFRVNNTNIRVRFVHSQIKRVLSTLKQRVGSDPAAKKQIDRLERTNDREFDRALSRSVFVPARLANRVKLGMAGLRGMITASARTLQTLPILAAMGTPGAIAGTLIVLDTATEAFTVKYAREIQEAFEQVPLRAFNSRTAAQWSAIINTSFWNWLFFAFGRPTLMQAIASGIDSGVPAPNVDTMLNVGGFGALSVVIYVAFTRGWMALRDKGQLSTSQIVLMMQGAGFLDVLTSILNSNPNWYEFRFFTWGPQWAIYLGTFFWSMIAPNRTDRLLLADTRIADWSDIHAEHTTNMSWHIEKPEDFAQALSVIREMSCERALIPPARR